MTRNSSVYFNQDGPTKSDKWDPIPNILEFFSASKQTAKAVPSTFLMADISSKKLA